MFQSDNVRSVKELNRFREQLAGFLYGRYGIDSLNIALLVLYFLLLMIYTFIHYFIFPMIMWIILAWSLFRSLSRNIYARQKENFVFLLFWRRFFSAIALNIRRIKEIKTHRFRKCQKCGVILRLPRKTGKHVVRCPKCQHRFPVWILF